MGTNKSKPPGRHDRPPGGSAHRLPGAGGFTPSVLLPVATRWLMRRSVGRSRAPASIPKQPGRAARFTDVSAAGQIGSRTDPPHCTPRHYVGVGKARDWPHPSERRGVLPDRRTPEPLYASALSPDIPLGLVAKAWSRRESQPFPSRRAAI